VGVPAGVFAALWERFGARGAPGTNAERGIGDGEHAAEETPWDDARVSVPDGLRREYLGESAAAERVRRAIVLAAGMDRGHVVLVQGESGTGKEIVARQIHALGGGRGEVFCAVNCGGIPTELFESELFGHVRGSFTGALRDKKGLWTLADRGTLFLDEVGDLPPAHQVKVLRALNEREYFPVGAEKPVRSNARVIAATHRDLGRMVRVGTFREDLYYRLFTFRIRTPALREHPGDIAGLARHFWSKLGQARSLPSAVAEELGHFPWPGNVRELAAFLVNLAVVANGRPVSTRMAHAVLRDRAGPVAERSDG
jgi:transcriptional regulator with GAF, ATPase, and Fis domain